MGWRCVAVGLLVGGHPASARAADFPVSGKTADLSGSGTAAKPKSTVALVLPNPLPAGIDPTVTGAGVELGQPGSLAAVDVWLPASGWKRTSSKAPKFAFKSADRLTTAAVGPGVLKVKVSGPAAYRVDAPQGEVKAMLAVGVERSCATFGGTIKKDVAGKFTARNAPPPAACVTFTCVTTTTTTTTTLAACPAGAACDDGNPCTHDDTCDAGGRCAAAPLTCVSDVCNVRVCDGTATCAVTPLTGPVCDDGNVCTTSDQCQAGTCAGTRAPDFAACDGGHGGCAVDVCLGGACTSLASLPDGLSCDDRNACTVGDTCAGGSCLGLPAPERTPCDDHDACTVTDICAAGGQCIGRQLPCPGADLCNDSTCDPATGVCSPVAPKPDATSCDNACTPDGYCAAGRCTGTSLLDGSTCDDGVSDCVLRDGNGARVGACAAGQCRMPFVLTCGGDDPCFRGQCYAQVERGTATIAGASGGCVQFPVECPAPLHPECYSSTCVSGICSTACTSALGCNAGVGPCGSTPNCLTDADCDDHDVCTTDFCDASSGLCSNAPVVCNDGDICSTDYCDPGFGCRSVPRPPGYCEDYVPCTEDVCVPYEGCRYIQRDALCADDDPCTTNERCVQGTLTGCVSEPTCPDQGICNSTVCDPSTGACSYPFNPEQRCPVDAGISFDLCAGHCDGGASGLACLNQNYFFTGRKTCPANACDTDDDCADIAECCASTLPILPGVRPVCADRQDGSCCSSNKVCVCATFVITQ